MVQAIRLGCVPLDLNGSSYSEACSLKAQSHCTRSTKEIYNRCAIGLSGDFGPAHLAE